MFSRCSGGTIAAIARTLLDTAGVLCLLGGETAGGLFFPSWTVGPFTGFLVVGLALLIARHTLWPRPSLPASVYRGAQTGLADPTVRLAWLLALGAAATIYGLGAISVSTARQGSTLYPFRVSQNEIENLPARFDAGWYLGVARNGYVWRPELSGHRHSMAFFPAYPAAMRLGGDLLTIPAKAFQRPAWLGGGNARMLWGGVAVSVLSLALALSMIAKLGALDGLSRGVVIKAVVLLVSYPFAFFFTAAYSESLFLLTTAGLLLAWRQRRVGRATLWGLAVGLVRSNGWTVSAAMILDLIFQPTVRERKWYIAAFSPILGAAAYSAYVWFRTGNPFEWALAQQGWGRTVSPFQFFVRRYEIMRTVGLLGYVVNNSVDAITFAVALLAIVAMAVYFFRRDWLYGGFVAAYLLPAVVIDLPATGRMTAVLFPVFFLLARAKGWAYAVLVGVFACGEVLLARQFFLWRPPF